MVRAGKVAAIAISIVTIQVLAAALVERTPTRAFALVAAFVLAVVVLTLPRAILVLSLPATYLYYRVGPASTDISLADVALATAVVAALPFVPWGAPRVRSMFGVVAGYLLVLALAVSVVYSNRAGIEWAHRAFLAAGGVLVGAAITQLKLAAWAMRAFVTASAIVAFASVVDVATRAGPGFRFFPPAYPFGIHKNLAGFLFVCALIVMMVARDMVGGSRRVRVSLMVLFFVGIAACQARGAAMALVIAVVCWSALERRVSKSPLVVLGLALLIAMTYATIDTAVSTDAASARFNSVNSRIATYDAALTLWRERPLVGVGLKFWRDPALADEVGLGEPHDLVVSALAESGIVGLAALGLLVGGAFIVVRRRRTSPLENLAAVILVATVVDSIVGIFWVAGSLTFMWIIVGMSCAWNEGEANVPRLRSREPEHFQRRTRLAMSTAARCDLERAGQLGRT